MLDKSPSIAKRVIEINRSSPFTQQSLTIAQQDHRPLSQVLAGLRAEVDSLTMKLAREHGAASDLSLRAEQISHAIQRLEWALTRESNQPTAG